MVVKAFAKINLTLDVVGKRHDGYHKLSSVMHEISLYDELDVTVRKIKGDNSAVVTSDSFSVPSDENNLCHRAAMLFLEEYGMASTVVNIDIKKKIPVAAGLGGGSSDAAAVIKALNKLLRVEAPAGDLERLAADIGADVPFFIRGKTQHARGMGEILEPLDFPYKVYYIICKPDYEALTKEIFRDFDNLVLSGVINSANFTTAKFLDCVRLGLSPFEHVGNMLSVVAENLFPEVAKIRKRFESFGANSCMTGSGTAVFGVFSTYAAAIDAYNDLKQDYENTFLTV